MQLMSEWYGVDMGGDSSAGGKKRKGETQDELPPKSRFVHAMALLLGRSATKADMTWSVEGESGKYVCTLALPGMDKTFTGEPAESKKGAEHNAAEAALE